MIYKSLFIIPSICCICVICVYAASGNSSKLYITGDSLICAGEETVLEAHGCEKYQWLDKDGNVVSESEFLIVKTSEEVTYTAVCLERCDCDGATVKDADGNEYPLTKVGNQCWMAENIRSVHYDTQSEMAGKEIKGYSSSMYDPWYLDDRYDQGGWTYVMTDEVRAKLGYFYSWAAVVGLPSETAAKQITSEFEGQRQGICPNGFHVPTASEWEELAEYVGGADVAGIELASTDCWIGGDEYHGNDTFGFTAYSAGESQTGIKQAGMGGYAIFASATANAWDKYYAFSIFPNPYSGKSVDKSLNQFSETKARGHSVRCIRNQ